MPLTVNGVVDTWLYSTLSQTSAINTAVSGRIWRDELPQDIGDEYPSIVYAFIAGNDQMYVNADRAYSALIYKVVVIGTTDFADLDTIYTLVDAAIHKGSGSVSGGEVFSCVRTQPLRLTETEEGGRKIRQAGGFYRIMARTT